MLIFTTTMTPNNITECNASSLRMLDFRGYTSAELDILLYTQTERILVYILMPMLCLIGIPSNVAFITMIIRVKNLQTATNSYLVNKAFCDIVLLLYSSAAYLYNLSITSLRSDHPMFSNTDFWPGCFLFWGGVYVLYYVSVLFITVVTIERYAAICHPLRHRIVAGKKHTNRLTKSSWLLGIALTVVTVFRNSKFLQFCIVWPAGKEFDSYPNTATYCEPSYPFAIVSEFIFLVPFVLAIIGNTYMNWQMIYTLSHRVSSDTYSANQKAAEVRVRNQVARMLIISSTIFFLCQTPYRLHNIQAIAKYYTDHGIFTDKQFGIVELVGNILVMVNCSTSCLIYFATSSHYRNGFMEAFF